MFPDNLAAAFLRNNLLPTYQLTQSSSKVVKMLPSFPLISWGGKPVLKKSAGGKEGRVFSILALVRWCQIRALGSIASHGAWCNIFSFKDQIKEKEKTI